MPWSCPLRARGAFRNHSSLNAATVTALNSPDGAVTGTRARTSGSKCRARCACGPGKVLDPGVIGAAEDGPAHPGPAGEAVDPGHRVRVPAVAGGHAGDAVVEVLRSLGVDHHGGGLDPSHPQRGVHHDPGQPHATGRGPEEVGIALGRELDPARRGGERQALDVRAERAVAVMVLAVDVRGDGPPDGDVAGPRRHRDEPAARHEGAHRARRGSPPPRRARARRRDRPRTRCRAR